MATVTSLGFSIFSRYDGTGVRRAERDVNSFSKKLDTWSGRMGAIATAAAGIGPAAIPVLAATTAAAVSASSALVGAAGAMGVFGAAASSQLRPVIEGFSNAAKAREAYSKATTKAQKDKALKDTRQALMGLNPLQRQAVAGMFSLQNAWKAFGKTAQTPILESFMSGMRGLKNLLVTFEPVVKPMANAVKELVARFEAFGKSSAMQWFSGWLATAGVAAFKSISNAAITFGRGLGLVFKQVAILTNGGKGFTDWLNTVANKFLKWAQDGKGVEKFLAYAKEVIPQVKTLISGLSGSFLGLSGAMAPIGDAVLKAIAPLIKWAADAVKKYPGLVQILWGMFMAFKALMIIKAVTAAVKGFTLALLANPIGLIVVAIGGLIAAFVYLYKTNEKVRRFIDAAWQGIKKAVLGAWNNIRPTLLQFWQYLTTVVAPAIQKFWRNVIVPVWNGIRNAIGAAWAFIRPKLAAFWSYLITVVAPALWKFYTAYVKVVWNAVRTAISSAWNFIRPKLQAFWSYLTTVVGPALKKFWTNWVQPTWNNVRNAISAAWGFIRPKLMAFWQYLTQTVGPRILGFWNNVVKPTWNSIREKIAWAWDKIRPIFDSLKNGINRVKDVFGAASTAIGKVWNKIRDAAKAPVRFLIDTVWNKGIVSVWNNVVAKIPGVGKVNPISMPKGLAQGGIAGSGYQSSKKDDIMMPMRRGEGVLVPEVVRALGPGFVHSLNDMGNRGINAVRRGVGGGLATGGTVNNDAWFRKSGYSTSGHLMSDQGLANGGIVGNVLGAVGGFIKAGKNFFMNGVDKAVKALTAPMLGGLASFGKTGIAGLPYQAASHLLGKMSSWMIGNEGLAGGGGASGVVDAARSYLGMGDHGGDNMNNQFNQMWGWGNGTPWCANFVSACVKKAGAQSFYPGYPSASVEGYYDAMQKVPWNSAQPGDLRTTGVGTHINIVEKPGVSGGIQTIGGNQGPVVNRRIDHSGYILRPKAGAPGARRGLGGNFGFTGMGRGGGVASGRATATWYGGPFDSEDNSRQASGIPHHVGSISSPYWPIGTKVAMGVNGRTMMGIVEEFGPAAWAVMQHSPPALIDVGYLTARAFRGGGYGAERGFGSVVDWTVQQWGNGRRYRYGGPGWEAAGGNRIGRAEGGIINGYASGGKMSPGELAVVGERGAELFRAGSGGGTVYPAGSFGGDTVQVVFNDKVYVKSEADMERLIVAAVDKAQKTGRLRK